MSRSPRQIVLAAAAITLVSLTWPALAGASTVGVSGSTMQVVDTADVPTDTRVRETAEQTYDVTEGGEPVTAVAPCEQVGPNLARCPKGGITRISVDARGGNDTIRVIINSAGFDTVLSGGQGDDVIRGGTSEDLMIGGPGGDQFLGGGVSRRREDIVSYRGVAEPVMADIGGGSVSGSVLDGPPGSRDLIDGRIDTVIGGQSFNTLLGDSDFNALVGGPKRDRLRGEEGDDELFGRRGRDNVAGGNGADKVVGGRGRDRMRGGASWDRLYAKDGFADLVVNCGPPTNPFCGRFCNWSPPREFAKFDRRLDRPSGC